MSFLRMLVKGKHHTQKNGMIAFSKNKTLKMLSGWKKNSYNIEQILQIKQELQKRIQAMLCHGIAGVCCILQCNRTSNRWVGEKLSTPWKSICSIQFICELFNQRAIYTPRKRTIPRWKCSVLIPRKAVWVEVSSHLWGWYSLIDFICRAI